MNKRTKFPSEAEIKEVRERLSQGPASQVLPKDASPVDKTKYAICQEIVIYMNKKKLTQRKLAEKIGENESLISKVVHYNIEEFTIDRLMKFLNVIYPNAEIRINVAS
jgi:predicted XRE-type DNA-binding protein